MTECGIHSARLVNQSCWLILFFGLAMSVRLHNVSAAAQTTSSEDRPPNVLVISIDDLNDWVGCLGGHPQVQTPHIDRLAASGVLFSNAHCQSPLCNPSRTSVMTGLRPGSTGIYGLAPWFRQLDEFKEVVTWPQHFQKNGYRTLTFGKTYHDAYPPAAGRQPGAEFDVWGYHGSGGKPRPEKKIINMQGGHPLMDWGPFPEFDHQQDDYQIASEAIAALESVADSDQPFMMHVGFRRPHVPCFAPPKWFALYPEESLIMPPIDEHDRDDTPRFSWYLHWQLPEPRLRWLQEAGEDRSLVRAYLASTSFVDSMVGRVLEALESKGLSDSTMVVLWSDHGYHLGEKLISGKNTLWERSTRVPLVMAGPGIRPGRCSQPVELLDMYPTTAEWCGLGVPKHLEGHSLVPQLELPNRLREFPALTTHNPGNHTVRDNRWRYIRYADGSEELYDMRTDPNEWTNLAQRPEYLETKQRLQKWLPEQDRPLAPGSRHRILSWDGKEAIWEGERIPESTDPLTTGFTDR